jgi:hypothetical protein
MKKVTSLFFLALLSFSQILACGNEYESLSYTLIDGAIKDVDYSKWDSYYFNHGFNVQELKSEKSILEAKIKKSNSYKHKSDLALVLLKLGEKENSLKILQQLIKKFPNEYNIVANLGTAYELNGKNDSALFYIKKAVKLNPDSHKGSEWIHVKILEAKLALQKDPEYLKQNSVLNLDLNYQVLQDQKPVGEELEKLLSVKKQLAWQLKERIAFVAAPDPIVSDLLLDLANLVALTDYLEYSMYVYNQALDYSPPHNAKLLEARDHVSEVIYYGKQKTKLVKVTLVVGGLIAFGCIIYWIRKRRKSRKQKMINVNAKKEVYEI